MPEGPIIYILKEDVQQFKGKKVVSASCNNKAIDAGMLTGQTISDFKIWGKHFLICFPKFSIRVHMMMFGSYRVNEHTEKLPRLHLGFSSGELNFYAVELQLIEESIDKVYNWTADVMNPNWSAKKALDKIKLQPAILACDALLNQQIFAGVGNIIKNEVLFRTRVHPLSVMNTLPKAKLNELLKEAVNYSFDFLKWKKVHVFSKNWKAYQQKSCPRDHIPFHKADTGKSRRTSYYCDVCQVLYGLTPPSPKGEGF